MTALAPALQRVGSGHPVYRLDLGKGENRLDRSSLEGLEQALDSLEGMQGPRALVTSGSGRHFCNGYDLTWLGAQSRDEQRQFIRDHQALLARFLLLPCPTVAVLNGHAIGAGALLALAHDQRLMQDARGWFCLPEIDARIPFRRGMVALLQARLTDRALRQTVLTGARLGAAAAAELGIVRELPASDDLLQKALAIADQLAPSAGETCGRLKSGMLGAVALSLRGGGLAREVR